MTSFLSSHGCNWSVGVSEHVCKGRGRFYKVPSLGCCGPYYFPSGGFSFSQGQGQYLASTSQSRGRCGPVFSSAVDDDGVDPDDAEDGNDKKESSQGETGGEFMGRNLLALNVMWKYMEQRSFPLTEEEYLLRLDDVANTLKCWGAVSHIRNSLAKLKERPRIGKV
ncbi:Uncharacterized protein TCM_011080 isoform 3 [Theobroma cacao]|uniref:Uncharacterized protein isoform 3 n=1 Tax=Theobroma cacao TaxID=3641 RepID=A0A061E866_THECC|nr:Uncharacterized protein TCM_011080 isoform 3 [Theobroma cacao]